MAQQTAVEWLENELADNLKHIILNNDHVMMERLFLQAKHMDKERRKEDIKIGYSQGYLDAQCNHVYDGDNFANEQEYLNGE